MRKFGGDRVSLVFLSLSLSLFFVAIVSLVVLLGFVFSKGVSSEETDSMNIFRYKYLKYDQKTKSSTVGFINFPEEYFGDDGFITYENELGDTTFIISDFESDEYECSGECFCDNESLVNRRSTTVFSRSLSLLVAALSSTLACQVARTRFDSACVFKFEDECEGQIRSEVSGCKKVKMEQKDYVVDEEILSKKKTKFPHPRKYLCHGKCMDRNLQYEVDEARKIEGFDMEYLRWFIHNQPMVEKMIKDFGCENYELEKKLTINMAREDLLEEWEMTELQYAQKHFTVHHLHRACERYSLKNYEIEMYGHKTTTWNGMCMGYLDDPILDDEKVPNPSSKCVKIAEKESI